MKHKSKTHGTNIRLNGLSTWVITLDKKDLIRKGYKLGDQVNADVSDVVVEQE
jgi:hypothetical protein